MRLGGDLQHDKLLRKYDIVTRCRPGLRAKHLDSEDIDFCAKFTHCIIMLGNNDISQHPTKHWISPETPLKTAARIVGFALCLKQKNVKVKVVGLFARPDVNYGLVQNTNFYISVFMQSDYVGPRKVHCNHFLRPGAPRDLPHFNIHGKKRVLALILRIIGCRF